MLINLLCHTKPAACIISIIIDASSVSFACSSVSCQLLHMWSDSPKGALLAHNFNVHFSPPPDGYTSRLTVYVCTVAKSSTVCFYWDFLLQTVWHPTVLRWFKMAPSCLKKQTYSRESPLNWLVRLGMELATFCDMYMELKTTWINAIWAYNVLSWNPLPLHGYPHPYMSACCIDYLVKYVCILSEMMENSIT